MAATREAMLEHWNQPSFWQRLTLRDGLWALLVLVGSGTVWSLISPTWTVTKSRSSLVPLWR